METSKYRTLGKAAWNAAAGCCSKATNFLGSKDWKVAGLAYKLGVSGTPSPAALCCWQTLLSAAACDTGCHHHCDYDTVIY